ncbi:MAG TPA: hypothetical protein VJU78_11195, partial [Chitinophagaceae bacterium]|nr:hypothetical protein [Chitinophagaceae bacterium]
STSNPPPYGYDDYGGGSNFVPQENCNDKALELLGSPVAEKQSVSQVSSNTITRTRTYHWVIYRQNWGLWQFTSHERGVHQKTISGSTHPWKWKSLTHESISKEGFWTGGTVDCSLNTWESHLALYTAGIQLNFTITASAICTGAPLGIAGTFNNSNIWDINE